MSFSTMVGTIFTTITLSANDTIPLFIAAKCPITGRLFKDLIQANMQATPHRGFSLIILESEDARKSTYNLFNGAKYAELYRQKGVLGDHITGKVAQLAHVVIFTSLTDNTKIVSTNKLTDEHLDLMTACSLEKTDAVYEARKRVVVRLAFEKGDREQALYWARINTADFPNKSFGHAILGDIIVRKPFVERTQDENGEAMQCFVRALGLNSKEASAITNKATLAAQLQKVENERYDAEMRALDWPTSPPIVDLNNFNAVCRDFLEFAKDEAQKPAAPEAVPAAKAPAETVKQVLPPLAVQSDPNMMPLCQPMAYCPLT